MKPKKRHSNVHAAYLILKKEGKILLGKRINTGYMDGYFGLPAGHAEEGESLSQTMIRETQEEIGLSLLPEQLNFVFLLHRFSLDNPSQQPERIDVFYEALNWQGQITNLEPEKCSQLTWFSPTDLPVNTVPYIKYALAKISSGENYSELDWDKLS